MRNFIYWTLCFNFFKIFPMKNKIYFESFLGRSISGIPKDLFDYIDGKDFKCVWGYRNVYKKNMDLKNINKVKKISLKYIYTIATSKYIITNMRMPNKFKKRKNQIYVQTWHGTPLKKLVFDMEKNHLPSNSRGSYNEEFLNDVKKWNYLISPNQYATEKFKSAFLYEGKIIEKGYPYQEKLRKNLEDNEIKKLKNKLNIPKDDFVVLYCPTFRDNKLNKSDKCKQSIKMDISNVKKSLGNNVTFLLRNHYLVNEIEYKGDASDFIDVSNYSDITEIFQISDLLITDYSSVFFDYIYLNRPIIFYQYDQKEYKEELRDFYIPLEDLPGEVIIKEKELYNKLKNIYNKDYKLEEFIKKYPIIKEEKNISRQIYKEIMEDE